MPTLFFLPMPLILAHHSELVIQCSVDEQTLVWTFALTKSVSMSGDMHVINARDWELPGYYTYKPRFDSLHDGPLLCTSDNISDALNYFGLYQFALQMDSHPLKTVTTFDRYEGRLGVDSCSRRASVVRLLNWSGYWLKDGTIQAKKRMRGSDDVPTSIILPVVPVYLCSGALRITLEAVWSDYDTYCGPAYNRYEFRGKRFLKMWIWMHYSKRTCCRNK